MSNVATRADARPMPIINRRAALAATGGALAASLATMAAPAALAASAPPAGPERLAELIEAHRWAHAEFLAAIDAENEIEKAYMDSHEPLKVHLTNGTRIEFRSDWRDASERIKVEIDKQYDRLLSGTIFVLRKTDEAAAALLERTVRKAKANDLRSLRKVAKEEQARKTAFGLVAAQKANLATSDAEAEAGRAVLAHHCATTAEVTMRWQYLRTDPGRSIFDGIGLCKGFTEALLGAGLSEGRDA